MIKKAKRAAKECDKEGRVYGTSRDELKNFNAVESAVLYDLWYKIAQNSTIYRDLVNEGVCLQGLAVTDKELWLELQQDVVKLKDEGLI